MGRVLRSVLIVFVSLIFSMVLGVIAVFVLDRSTSWNRPAHGWLSLEAAIWISILTTTLPAIISGSLIGLAGLRLLKAAIIGILVYLIPIALIAAYILATETKPEYLGIFEYAGFMMGIFGFIGAINGVVCGLINSRTKP